MEVIFVHGALVRDGEWWWRPTAQLLLERTGVRSRAVRLPSCGESGGSAAGSTAGLPDGLSADAAALRAELDGVDSAIVVGHSYGGTVIAQAGSHPSVAGLMLISSYLPEIGWSQAAIMADEPDPAAISDLGDGRLGLSGHDAASFGARFLQDADPGILLEAWERVAPQAASAFVTPTTAAGWQGVDSSYLVCADDRSTSLELQRRHAERATRSVELPTGHHPFLSRPELVVAELERMLRDR